jgi:hypothetical protein
MRMLTLPVALLLISTKRRFPKFVNAKYIRVSTRAVSVEKKVSTLADDEEWCLCMYYWKSEKF